MRLLDLFCGAGGASEGYRRAGWEVVGVDLVDRGYPWEFHQTDALSFAEGLVVDPELWERFDAIHASPPCQAYAGVTAWRGRREDHPDLVAETRAVLRETGLPWIMENVREAPLHASVMLCGSMFGLKVRRHRYFEISPSLAMFVPPCDHRGLLPFMHKGERAYADAMGCDWMPAQTARLAIPPAYTEFLGRHLADAVMPQYAALDGDQNSDGEGMVR